MNNTPWSAEEIDALALQWPQFHEQFPERSYHAFRHKKGDLTKNRVPTSKKVIHEETPEPVSDADLFDAIITFQDTLKAATATKIEHSLTVETDEPIAICFPSDWHIGSAGTDLRRLKADCELIASHPRLYAAVGGDPVDNFILDKMSNAARSQSIQVDLQWRAFRYLIKMLLDSGSLLWASSGNHDAWTLKVAGIDGVLSALRDLPVLYTGEGALVTVTVGNTPYRIYRKHRPSRFRSAYNQTHFIRMMLALGAPWEFDIGVSEHLHQAEVIQYEYRKLDRVGICCGTYKMTDPYAESIGYYGGGYGVPTVVLYPNRREMLPFPSIARAIDALDGVPLHQAS